MNIKQDLERVPCADFGQLIGTTGKSSVDFRGRFLPRILHAVSAHLSSKLYVNLQGTENAKGSDEAFCEGFMTKNIQLTHRRFECFISCKPMS
jgi:hypothetical protein